MAYVTLSVAVTDPEASAPVCDAEVTAVDDAGHALRFTPGPDRCSQLTYDGREATFTVTARKAGYADASERVVMRKLPCQFSAPPVQLTLKREIRSAKD
jgi:hypothetical protein